jgi:hypothetical protein
VSDYLDQRRQAYTLLTERAPIASFTVPVRVAPKGNGSQGTTKGGRFARAEATAKQRRLGSLMGSQLVLGFRKATGGAFYVVRLTRIAPRLGDDDNITAAMKPWRDGIAAALGIDDRDSFVRYVVDQERGKPKQYAVRGELYVSKTGAT